MFQTTHKQQTLKKTLNFKNQNSKKKTIVMSTSRQSLNKIVAISNMLYAEFTINVLI